MKPLAELRLRADRDKKLSDAAARLLALIVDERFYKNPESEFPFTRSDVHRLTGKEDRQCYRLLRELEKRTYLKLQAVKGSPPKSYFIFCLNSDKKVRNNSDIKGRVDSDKKVRNHIYNPLRGESLNKEGGKKVPLAGISKFVKWDGED